MRAVDVRISNLNTCQELYDMIQSVEGDYRNVVGGGRAWDSGYTTELTKTAAKKVSQLSNKLDRLPFNEDSGECECPRCKFPVPN